MGGEIFIWFCSKKTKKINFLDWGGKPFFSELNNSVFRMEQKSFHIIQLTK